MSDPLGTEFPSEAKAESVREMLLAMQKEYLIELRDAVVVVKDDNRRIELNRLLQLVAHSAGPGMLWGSLIALIFMMPLALVASPRPQHQHRPGQRSALLESDDNTPGDGHSSEEPNGGASWLAGTSKSRSKCPATPWSSAR